MIDYIEPSMRGIMIIHGTQAQEYEGSYRQFFNEWLLQQLSTLDGRQDALKRLTQFARNVPVVIDASHCFYFTHCARTLQWRAINYFAVETLRPVSEETCRVTFHSGASVVIPRRLSALIRRHKRIERMFSLFSQMNVKAFLIKESVFQSGE